MTAEEEEDSDHLTCSWSGICISFGGEGSNLRLRKSENLYWGHNMPVPLDGAMVIGGDCVTTTLSYTAK